MSEINDLSQDCLREFAHLLTGEKLGSGTSRDVFEHPSDPTKVIKVENSARNFQNMKEWLIWKEFMFDDDVAKWLAPCHAISHSGTFLIMERTYDLQPDQVPEKLPYFLTDHKIDNYGMIGTGKEKRVVCHDYGTASLNMKMRMRNWGDG